MAHHVQRWLTLAQDEVSTSVLAIALIYMDRLFVRWPCLDVRSPNMHLLFAASMVIAAKFNEDGEVNLNHLCQVSGVTKCHMVRMERELLHLLDFQLFVGPEEFQQGEAFFVRESATRSHARALVRHVLRIENLERSYFS